MIAQNLKAAVDNGKDVAAREAMSQAQYIAGMGFSNVGLGIVHSMAHPLGAFYDTPHGVANALLLPYVMEYNAESPAAPKYIHIAKAMGVDTTGMSEAEGVKAAVEAVKALSASINIPQKLHEINVKEEDIPALAVAAFNDVCTGGKSSSYFGSRYRSSISQSFLKLVFAEVLFTTDYTDYTDYFTTEDAEDTEEDKGN